MKGQHPWSCPTIPWRVQKIWFKNFHMALVGSPFGSESFFDEVPQIKSTITSTTDPFLPFTTPFSHLLSTLWWDASNQGLPNEEYYDIDIHYLLLWKKSLLSFSFIKNLFSLKLSLVALICHKFPSNSCSFFLSLANIIAR